MTKIRSTDGSHIDDRRGQGGGGLGGMFPGLGGGSGSFPFPMKAGGGLLGIILVLAALFLPKLLGAATGTSTAADTGSANNPESCVTDLEQVVCGVTNDVQLYWAEALPQYFNTAYQETNTVWFTGGTSTGCGQASSETGPFYCPADNLVYIDLEFLQQLEEQLIGSATDLAEQYILAHEYGHHVQNILGTNAMVQEVQQSQPDRANEYSVAMELQADCFAGAWVGDRDVLENEAELEEAIAAAEGVGDDRIQEKTQGRVDPESWTHGSAEQRRTWFLKGYNTDPSQCDTFAEITG